MRQESIRRGQWAAMITPFTENNLIDYPAVKQLLDWYARHGIAGVLAVCQSSEMHKLSLEERVALGSFVKENIPHDMSLAVCGHISNSFEDQVQELQAMAKIGTDALVLNTNRIAAPDESDDVWIETCDRLLQTLPDVPLGLYECPIPYTRVMSEKTIAWCISTGKFVFIKDVCCDPVQVGKKAELCKNSSIRIFTADTATLLPSLRAGADGYCGIMSNFCPQVIQELTQHWQEDDARAEKLQHFATLSLMTADLMYPVCAKYCMRLEGLDFGLVTRNRAYEQFGDMERLYVTQIHALWKELNL